MVFKRRISLVFLLGGVILAITGCSGFKAREPSPPAPTCAQALAGQAENLTDHEIEHLLDAAAGKQQMAGCWEPLMKRCLDEKREVPFDHLARAVHTFNQHQHKAHFHKAVFRYLSAVEANPDLYSSEARELLTAYCRHCIRSAESSRNPHLKTAMLFARRLDPGLYEDLFQ